MPQFLNILLQKSDPKLSWGFDVVGGREYGLPLTICQVSSDSFSSQYLSRGDEIVKIEGIDASLFTEAEALRFIKKPSKSLDLVILKRSPDELQNRNDAKSPRFRKQTPEKSKPTSLRAVSPEKISRRKLTTEKKKVFKRSTSVPLKYSSCGPPTYQLRYTVPDVDTSQSQRVSWIRDRSESPPFWRNPQSNVGRTVNKNERSSRVFWRQMENSGTDGECDSEVAQYCRSRSRRDLWNSSIDSSTQSMESRTSTSRIQSHQTSNKEANFRVPVQFDFNGNRRSRTGGIFDVDCDSEILAQYSTICKDRWKPRSSSIDSTVSIENTSFSTDAQNVYKEDTREYRYRIPVHFDYYEHREKEHKQRRVNFSFSDQQQFKRRDQTNVSKVYLSPYDLKMHKNIIQSLQPLKTGQRRQTSQPGDKSPQAQTSCESTPTTAAVASNSNAATPPAPPAPAPPPPPPPTMNGTIPTIRLKSEISDRCEPPAKILNAMSKDKKPFTYTPGGIDLSEIKSPRMQRRIVKNAQTPDDIILPTPTPTVNPSTLPPSAVAAMTPQIAIPVFPQNGIPKKQTHNLPPPQMQSPQKQSVSSASPTPPPMQKQTIIPPPPPQRRSVSPTPLQQPTQTVVITSQPSQPAQQQSPRMIVVNSQQPTPVSQQQHNQQPTRTIVITSSQPDKPKDQPRAQVGSIYVPPVVNEQTQNTSKASFPVLREAPTPWLQKNQHAQENNTPAWVNRNKNNAENEQKEVIYERKPRVQQVQTEKEFSELDKPVAGTRVIPIQIESSNQTFTQSNSRQNSQRWGTPANNHTVQSNQNNITVINRGNGANSNKSFNEPDTKPIQSRSFKVIQRITGSEDDTVDYSSEVPYNSENVPLSQLRRLHLCDDDQAFMNKVKSQVDEDIFLHSETDPRYRGSAIPSKAFRKLQNMTDSGQVIPVTIEIQTQDKSRPSPPLVKDTNEEPQKKYIPPSERQAEQDLRKYMGSSIPSRSFRMLQAMTSTQPGSQNTKRIDNIDEDARFLYPNPYSDPPLKSPDEIDPFWVHYVYLFDLVSEQLPNKLYPSVNDDLPPEEFHVSDFHRDEHSENVEDPSKDELIIDSVVKDDSDHEVSLTVCIPLRRKSKSVEYHEEVTLKNCPDLIKNTPNDSRESPKLEPDPKKCPDLADNSQIPGTEDSNEKTPNSSDTEHSESSSVDFWKEMATDEDVYFKPRSTTPGPASCPRSSAYEDTTTDEDGYFNPKAAPRKLPESQICNDEITDEDALFPAKPSSINSDEEVESRSYDEELFESNRLEPVVLDEMNLEDFGFKMRPKTPAFERRSESPAWYEGLTDEDGYSRSRSKTPAFDRFLESPHICDQPTTNHRLNEADSSGTPRDSWELGQDIKNYCKYTSMDSETNSSSSGSTEDLDEPFENSSSSSSSDENDSYNVYEFSTNIPSQPPDINEPPPPDDPSPEHPDEEDDSGMSEADKQTTEPELLGTELRKLSKYQRANTHSRLLRILQEEEDKRCGKSDLAVRKQSLSLPLGPNSWLTESVSSSSGINSPLSPVVNEKLVSELVQSLLNGKGPSYRELPAEKLREAAIKSLYESCSDTSRACSPYCFVNDKTKTPAGQQGDTSQPDCYESYEENSIHHPGFDIFPSRAFKNLQSGRSTPMNWPKCPLLSSHQSDHPSNPSKLNSTPDTTHDR